MDDHVVFFFGSGISRPTFRAVSDFDFEGSVKEVTQKVLNAPLVFTEHKRYPFPVSAESNPNMGEPHETSEERVTRLRNFLDAVRRHAEPFLDRFNRDVTYEELYSLCGEVQTNQKKQALAHQPVNPEVSHFAEALQGEVGEVLLDSSEDPRSPLAFTANEATVLISGVVRELLSNTPEIQGLDPLLAAIEELDCVTIVTLNHDLLLEQLLKEHNIDFDDGFEREDSDVRRYSPDRLFDGPNDVTVIKPHGSVNWYIDREQSEYVAFPINDPIPEPGELQTLLQKEPFILHGYRKEERYPVDIVGDMVDALLLALHETSTVIESGFGWTDYGMYHHLNRYLGRSEQNRLLLLHQTDDFQQGEESTDPPHPMDYSNSFGHPSDGLIRSLPKYLSETSWDEIQAHVDE
jgi:hypothetical protein